MVGLSTVPAIDTYGDDRADAAAVELSRRRDGGEVWDARRSVSKACLFGASLGLICIGSSCSCPDDGQS